ncbi:MAG: phage head morphogenesis protein [Patescibacteria group bacterium]|nr:phage head morphogenesis protein [Patescibacteria group bacterium]
MQRSLTWWLRAQYRAMPPELAQDAPPDAGGFNEPRRPPRRQSPAMAMRARMKELVRQWQAQFDAAAPDLAKHFTAGATKHSDAALKSALKRAGFSVEFKLTAAQNDVVQATVGQNVALIKSIASEHLSKVEGIVLRSVQAGRDLSSMTEALEHQYGITRRRAAFIARDQNNKATAAVQRVRQVDLGLTEAIWLHSGGGKEPRPTHVKAGHDRQHFDVREGWLDPAVGKRILPGELPGCRCVYRAVVPGFS